MEGIVIPPSPNWYLPAILCVSVDGTIIYGSSSNDITILTPIDSSNQRQRFTLNIIHTAHKKRVTCLALCPNWNATKHFVSGSEDGIVKLWNKTSNSFSIAHNIHLESDKEVVGVTFLNEKEVVSVGNSGVIVLWNINHNTVKVDNKVLKSYKPMCISLCPHKPNTFAIGTKQGVVLVLSVTDKFMMLFKAHGHETEITSLSWCPTTYCDPLEKIVALKRHKVKTFRVRKISNRKSENMNKLSCNSGEKGLYQQSSGEEADESDIFDVNKETGLDECVEASDSDSDCDKHKSNVEDDKKDDGLSEAFSSVHITDTNTTANDSLLEDCKKLLNFMNSKKALKSEGNSFIVDPDSTFNESHVNVADESDIFDIYEEPPFYEFGHSKFIPKESEEESTSTDKLKLENNFLDECKKLKNIIKGNEDLPTKNEVSDIDKCEVSLNTSTLEKSVFDIYEEPPFHEFGHSKYVPTKSEKDTDTKLKSPKAKLSSDFLEECNKLKEKFVQIKSDDKSSENESISVLSNEVNKLQIGNSDDSLTKVEESSETQVESRDGNYFFLSSACKNGKICIWRWGGNLVSCGVVSGSKEDKFKKLGLPWSALCWISSKLLLVASRGAHLLRCNFNSIYPKSKGFGFSVIHEEHLRGLYCIGGCNNLTHDADDWRSKSFGNVVWTVGQDRLLVAYSLDDNKVICKMNTIGGYVTNIVHSPIDPNRFAISAGDGVVRIWDMSGDCDENNGLGIMKVFWQNVQGKVQACDWHPVKENIVAFGNAEGRVGLIDASSQNAAKILPSSLPLGVHGLCWGPKTHYLYVHGAGKLVMYDTSHPTQDPREVSVNILSRAWEITCITWSEKYFTVGSKEGGVALLEVDYPHQTVTHLHPHRKRVTCLSWHPLAVSSEDDVSQCSDLLAASANNSLIVILKLVQNEEGVSTLEPHCEVAHSGKVNKVCWSPHHSGRLLSVSSDNYAQVYDIINKCPLHTLVGHTMNVLCCLWSPVDANLILTAGEDFSLRVWNLEHHPPQEIKPVNAKHKRKMKLASLELQQDKVATCPNDKQNKSKAKDEVSQMKNKNANVGIVLAQKVKTKHAATVMAQSPMNLYWKQVKDSKTSVEGCRRLLNHYISKLDNNQADIDYSGGFDYLRVYGSHTDVNHLLDIEQQRLAETLSWDNWMAIGLLRGDVKNVLEKAKENKKLSPALLCLAPSVSNRFWKDMMASYLVQLEGKSKTDGEICRSVYKCIVKLIAGNVHEACDALVTEDLILEAFVLAKLNISENIVDKYYLKLLDSYKFHQRFNRLAECYVSSGQLMDAAVQLGQSNDEEYLALAAHIAKVAENNTMADSVKHTQ